MKPLIARGLMRTDFVVLGVASAAVLFVPTASAKDFLVSTKAAYEAAAGLVAPGDRIVLQNGTWEDFEIVLDADGTPDRPITLVAETPGKVLITGRSNLQIGGEHLTVSGLTFTDGYSPTSEVISFRISDDRLASHTRLESTLIDDFNKPNRQDQDSWIVLYGQNNVVTDNAFVGKTNRGPTMIVRLVTEDSQNNNHLIEGNFFGERAPLGGNGGETLRIGVSQTSRTNSGTVVRGNLFERCDGEVEIISIKSEGNVVTENTFYESRGSVVFRHGGRNEVSRNVFLGNGVADTGGVRVINDNQTVKENYLSGLRGRKFMGALVLMNGVPNSPENRYHQVDNAQIINNSFIDVLTVGLGVGSDAERSAVPINSVVRNNVFLSDAPTPLGVFDDIGGISFENNVTNNPAFARLGAKVVQGISRMEGTNGLAYPTSAQFSAGIGAPRDLAIVSREDVGPDHYVKPALSVPEGETVRVGRGTRNLISAINAAKPGDVLELADASYTLSEPLILDKPITLVGVVDDAGPKSRLVGPRSDHLFVLAAGARVVLENVQILGRASDAAVIRATGQTYEGDYSLTLRNISVATKRRDRVGALLSADSETFAEFVVVESLSIADWPGDVIDLSGDGLDGWYLTDDISITRSQAENIGGTFLSFGREGRDESTFGPRVTMAETRLTNVGADGFALRLNGVDQLSIENNQLTNVGDVFVKRRVLGYPYQLSSNDVSEAGDITLLGVEDEALSLTLTGRN